MENSSGSFKLESYPNIDWSDVEPLTQYEGRFPILNIQYSPKYTQMMDIFRRIVNNREVSERAYYLTEEVVKKMCGSYSAWYLRKLCLEQLKYSYQNELEFITKLMYDNEKNYQIWEHRRFVITKINSPEKELDFINSILAKDNKNIHAWGYRKWLTEKFGLIEEEKKNIEIFFEEDIRNNSAWNYRYFLYKEGLNKEDFSKELMYIFKALNEVQDNEAAWNYLNGWFSTYNFECFGQKDDYAPAHLKKFNYSDYPEVEKFLRDITEKNSSCRFAWITLINVLVWKKNKQTLVEIFEILDTLCLQHDKIRVNYWAWFKQNLEKDFANVLESQMSK